MRYTAFYTAALIFLPLHAYSQAPTVTHSGQNALQLNRTTFSVDSGLDREAPGTRVAVTGGNSLVLSFWARNAQVNPSFFNRVSIAFFTSSNAWLGDTNYELSTSVPTAWTNYTESPLAVPATAAEMNLAFRLDGNSSVVLDDISVLNTSAGNAEILTNGGFETWTDPLVEPAGWRFFGPADGSFVRLGGPPTAAQEWQLYSE